MRDEPYQFRTLVDDERNFLEQIPNVSLRIHKCFRRFFFFFFSSTRKDVKENKSGERLTWE